MEVSGWGRREHSEWPVKALGPSLVQGRYKPTCRPWAGSISPNVRFWP